MKLEYTDTAFRADLYMRGMSELAPILRDAIDRVTALELEVRQALGDLALVQRQIDRLGQITEYAEGDPERTMRESASMGLLVRRQIKESYVYFIEAGDFIKIGVSRDPIIRLGQIRAGGGVAAPEGLSTANARLLAVEQGDRFEEKALHKRFAEHRHTGEWFAKNDRLIHYIKSIATPT